MQNSKSNSGEKSERQGSLHWRFEILNESDFRVDFWTTISPMQSDDQKLLVTNSKYIISQELTRNGVMYPTTECFVSFPTRACKVSRAIEINYQSEKDWKASFDCITEASNSEGTLVKEKSVQNLESINGEVRIPN